MGPSEKIFVLSVVILVAKMIFLSNGTGLTRMRKKRYSSPEDATRGGTAGVADETVERWRRAQLNCLENELPWFMVAFLYVSTAPSKDAVLIYCGTYVFFRVMHTAVYLLGLQPWRTIAFAGGTITTVGMLVRLVRVAV